MIKATINGVNYVYCKECGKYLKEFIVFKSKCIQCSGEISLVRQ